MRNRHVSDNDGWNDGIFPGESYFFILQKSVLLFSVLKCLFRTWLLTRVLLFPAHFHGCDCFLQSLGHQVFQTPANTHPAAPISVHRRTKNIYSWLWWITFARYKGSIFPKRFSMPYILSMYEENFEKICMKKKTQILSDSFFLLSFFWTMNLLINRVQELNSRKSGILIPHVKKVWTTIWKWHFPSSFFAKSRAIWYLYFKLRVEGITTAAKKPGLNFQKHNMHTCELCQLPTSTLFWCLARRVENFPVQWLK